MLVKIVCAWCQKWQANVEWPSETSAPAVTHTICQDCLRVELAKVGK